MEKWSKEHEDKKAEFINAYDLHQQDKIVKEIRFYALEKAKIKAISEIFKAFIVLRHLNDDLEEIQDLSEMTKTLTNIQNVRLWIKHTKEQLSKLG